MCSVHTYAHAELGIVLCGWAHKLFFVQPLYYVIRGASRRFAEKTHSKSSGKVQQRSEDQQKMQSPGVGVEEIVAVLGGTLLTSIISIIAV